MHIYTVVTFENVKYLMNQGITKMFESETIRLKLKKS